MPVTPDLGSDPPETAGVPGMEGPRPFAADLPGRAADKVDLLIDTIHDKVIRPILLATRVVAFGFLVAVMTVVVLILFSIAAVRLCDSYFFGGRVWASDALLGAVLVAGGLVAWFFRTPRRSKEDR